MKISTKRKDGRDFFRKFWMPKKLIFHIIYIIMSQNDLVPWPTPGIGAGEKMKSETWEMTVKKWLETSTHQKTHINFSSKTQWHWTSISFIYCFRLFSDFQGNSLDCLQLQERILFICCRLVLVGWFTWIGQRHRDIKRKRRWKKMSSHKFRSLKSNITIFIDRFF